MSSPAAPRCSPSHRWVTKRRRVGLIEAAQSAAGRASALQETALHSAASALMRARQRTPFIYERLWRPLGGRLLMGAAGPGIHDQHRIALSMLDLSPNDSVLDVACGPGDFTRDFACATGEGLVVGLDASKTMLDVAVRKTERANLAYVRGDAQSLPFRDGSFDAICCFAALYLIEKPMRALDEIVRVLAPGGRVALLSSCHRGPLPARVTNPVVQTLTGVRIFARDELTRALCDRGSTDIEQHVVGLAQFVSARKLAVTAHDQEKKLSPCP
jgi:SAM-dependent methyltransferase